MPSMPIKFMGSVEENPWPDLTPETVIHTLEPIEVALVPGGMQSGAASAMIKITLPDGRVVLAETSAALFMMAGQAAAGFIDRMEAEAKENGAKN